MTRGYHLCVATVLVVSMLPSTLLGGRADGRPRGPGQESGFTLEGKITQKGEGKLTVSTEENIVFHVRYDEKTDVQLKDGARGSDKDLKTGLKVRVEGDLSENGEIFARKIRVLSRESANQERFNR